ncbi:MAG: anthranilate synthase component II [Bacteroidia bacterium]
MKILILDNYDSFTFNLVHLVAQYEGGYVVARNNEISVEEVNDFDKILLSPGPGLPKHAGIMPELIRRYSKDKSILGVCLGLQGITENFGGKLHTLSDVLHGRQLKTLVVDDTEILFKDIPKEFEAGRYHSWVADKNNFPDELKITATDDRGEIMALSHKELNVKGVQFHPESIMTPHGHLIIKNWLQD